MNGETRQEKTLLDQLKYELGDAAETGLGMELVHYVTRLVETGEGPPFARLGGAVRYRRADLDDWVRSRIARSTSDA